MILDARYGDEVKRYLEQKDKYGTCALQYDRVGVSRLTETGNNNLNTRGAPDTVRLPIQVGKPNLIWLTEPIQLWMFQLMRERVPSMSLDEAKKSWRSLLMGNSGDGNNRAQRCFCDFSGSTTNADYINRAQLDKEPIGLNHILTGGTVLKIIGEDNRKNIKTDDCWIVEAIDPLGDFKQYHPSTHPHLFFFPTISSRLPYLDSKGKPTGKFIEYISDPFPQFDDKSVMPVFGQRGANFTYVPKSRMKVLTGARKSPFRHSTEPGYPTHPYPDPYPVGWLQ